MRGLENDNFAQNAWLGTWDKNRESIDIWKKKYDQKVDYIVLGLTIFYYKDKKKE